MKIRAGGLLDVPAINAAGLRINTRVRPEALFVAEEGGEIIGYAYSFLSQMHPTRYWAEVVVQEGLRRQGIGSALALKLAKSRRHNHPFYVRLPLGDDVLEWIYRIGGRVFQTSPPMALSLHSRANLNWLAGLGETSAGIHVVGATELTNDQSLEAFLKTYRWRHSGWMEPPADQLVAAIHGPDLRENMHPEISSFAVRGEGSEQEIVAGAWCFATDRSLVDATAETIDRNDPSGADALAACVRRSALSARRAGFETLRFEGLETDVHLAPLIAQAPAVTGTPTLWIEYDPSDSAAAQV